MKPLGVQHSIPTRRRRPVAEEHLRVDEVEDHPITAWWISAAALFLAAIAVFLVGELRGYETGRGLIAAPFPAVPALALALRARRAEPDFDLGGIVITAFSVKLLATFGRFWMTNHYYNGGDSTTYDYYGRLFSPSFRRLSFNVDPGLPIPGTGFLRVLTGIVYALVGDDFFVGFLAFVAMSFVGCWFFYQAFALAMPDGDRRRYALLVFFWPTLTFWPAAIGKESWMLLALGLTSYGAAALYRRRPMAFPTLVLGVAGAALPRPHIAIVVVASLAVGLVMGSVFSSGDNRTAAGFGTKLAGALFLLIAGSLLAPKVATFLQIDDVGGSGFVESLDEVQRRTSQGGSNFAAATIRSPVDYPWAAITVLFRPFPWEARSATSLLSATEGSLLLGLLLLSVRQILRLPGALVRNAYVAYAFAFAFMFVYVFAFIGNFGILTRQRAQLLPFLFVFIALPLHRKRRRTSPTMDEDELDVITPAYLLGGATLAPPWSRT